MFEYEGSQYSLEEVQQRAMDLGMSIDQYVEENGLKQVEQQVEQPMPEGEKDENGVPIFDPNTLPQNQPQGRGDVASTFETPFTEEQIEDVAKQTVEVNKIKESTQQIFGNKIKQYGTVKAPDGRVTIDYNNEGVVDKVATETMTDFVQNDEETQMAIERAMFKNKDKIQEEVARLSKEMFSKNIDDLTEEDFKAVSEKANKEINKIIFSDQDVKKRIESAQMSLDEAFGEDSEYYTRLSTTTADIFGTANPLMSLVKNTAFNAAPNTYMRMHGGFRKINTSIESVKLGGDGYVQVKAQHERNLDRAQKEGWDDSKVGYMNSNGSFMVAAEGQNEAMPVASGYTKKTTWGEAKSLVEQRIDEGEKKWVQDFDDVMNRMAVDASYGHVDIRDILESPLETIRDLSAEQIPQMASALLSFGTIPSMQMAGQNYFDQIKKKAIVSLGLGPGPHTEQEQLAIKKQMQNIVEGDEFNEIGESAAVVGVSSGLLEYVGASSVLRASKSAAKATSALGKHRASLLKGQFRRAAQQYKGATLDQLQASFDEGMTEIFQQAISDITTGDWAKENYIQGGGAGAVLGFVMPFSGNIAAQTTSEIKTGYKALAGKIDVKGMNEFHAYNMDKLRTALKNKEITQEEFEQKAEQLEDFRSSSEYVSKSMSDAQKEQLFQTIQSRNKAERDYKKFMSENAADMKDLAEQRKEEESDIDESVKAGLITEEEAKLQKQALAGKYMRNETIARSIVLKRALSEANINAEVIKEYNRNLENSVKVITQTEIGAENVIIAENNRDFAIAYLKEKGKENPTDQEIEQAMQSLEASPGVYAGREKIIINSEGAVAMQNIATASHEVLHAALKSTMLKMGKENAGAVAISMGKALNEYLIELEDAGKIKGMDEFRQRMLFNYVPYEMANGQVMTYPEMLEAYGEKAGVIMSKSTPVWDATSAEETITVLSEMMTDGRIQYDASLMEKLGDVIRRILQSVGLKNVEFNSGEYVFRFVRDYNKSVGKGRLTKAQKDVIAYGGKGSLVEIDPNSVGSRAAEDAFSTDSSKKGPSKIQKEFSDKVNKLWEENGIASLYEIAELYRPMFRKIAIRGNWDQLPGWDDMKDIIEDDALTSHDGMLGILMTFNPDKGVPLSAYINKYFALRAARVKDMRLGKSFDLNVDDLKGGGPAVSEEESIEDAIDNATPAPNGGFSRIRRKLGLDEQQMNAIRSTVIRALSLAPDVTATKKWTPSVFRTYLQKVYESQIFKLVKNHMGAKQKDYIFWARKSREWIAKEVSLSTLIRFKNLNGILYEPILDKDGNHARFTRQEAALAGIKDIDSGVRKYRKITPTEEQWLDYIDPTRVGMSWTTLGTRKDTLAKMLSIELGLDATMEVMQNPNQQDFTPDGLPIEGKVIDMYERLLTKNADVLEESQLIARVADIVNRDPNIKFSSDITRMGHVSDIRMAELIFNNPEPILDAYRDTINVYRLMDQSKKDNSLGQLKITMANSLLNAMKGQYRWLDQNSAEILANQLASDFVNIARYIDFVNLAQHESSERQFIDALSGNLLNISTNVVLNEGFEKIFGGEKEFTKEATANALNKISTYTDVSGNVIDYVNGDRQFPVNASSEVAESSVKGTTAMQVLAEVTSMEGDGYVEAADLQLMIASSLLDIKKLYADGTLTRDEVHAYFDAIFSRKNGKPAVIEYAAVPVAKMKNLDNNVQKINTIPTKYLSGFLANAVLKDTIVPKNIAEVLGNFGTIAVNKAYAKKLVDKQGTGMPHFRDGYLPGMLSRLSKVVPNKQGTSNVIEFYRNNVLGEVATSEIEEASKDLYERFFTTDYTSPVYEVDIAQLVSINYNVGLANDINNMMDNRDLFSKEEGKKKKKTNRQVESEIQDILDELEQSGTLSEDPIAQAKQEEEQRLEALAKEIDSEFNTILEEVTGIDASAEYSRITAKELGRKSEKRTFYVPPAHDDFRGLIENYLVGKKDAAGKHLAFFEEYLFHPYYDGVNNYSSERVRMLRQFKEVRKTFKSLVKDLKKEAFPGMTVENAIRVYIWTRKGYEIDGLSNEEIDQVQKFVLQSGIARDLAFEVMKITDLHGHIEPKGRDWDGGSLIGDIIDSLRKNSRKKYLEEFNKNVDFMFNEKNKNKLRAAFGNSYVDALEDILYRMKSGRNRSQGMPDNLSRNFYSWLNGSVGVVMFANTRSAILQLISVFNYINLSDNNPFNVAAAFADQNQFWADVKMLINSDFMVERRNGLKIDINEAEIAEAAAGSTNKIRAAFSWLLAKGFAPTQLADSLAIVLGGAPFFRNRVKSYLKSGLDQKEAEMQAFIDWRNKTEESQQSSSPDRISKQQASPTGRLMLTFANTQSQYARIIKKEYMNLKNRRGSAVESLSKIAYYGALQNAMFVALQSAMLASVVGLDDGDEKEEDSIADKDGFKLINGILDSILRGASIAGHVVSVLKNLGVEAFDRSGRPNPDFEMLVFKASDIMPAIGSKTRRLRSAAYYFNKANRGMKKGETLYSPEFFKGLATAASFGFNLPADRVMQKMENVNNAIDMEDEYDEYAQIMMMLGWPDYQIGVQPEEKSDRNTGSRRTRSRNTSTRRTSKR